MNNEATAYILDLVRTKSTISYGDFAKRFGFEMPLPAGWNSSTLGLHLAALTEEDIKHGRPLRTGVLVCQKTGEPGAGYWTALRHRLGVDLKTEEEKTTAWNHERTRAAACMY